MIDTAKFRVYSFKPDAVNNFKPKKSDTLEIFLEDLKRNYNNPGHPIAFAGINQINDYYNGKIPTNRIRDILSEFETYTLNREFHSGQRNPSYTHFKRYQFQMDLVEIQDLAEFNDGVRYLLNVIDTFTRFAFVRPLKNKTAVTVLNAFKTILIEAGSKPFMIVMDRGTEFSNKLFSSFCQQQKIRLINPQASTHAAYIERFNRTLQTIIYKFLTENETKRFIDKLQDLVKTYNYRKHRIIQMSPIQAENSIENQLQISLNFAKNIEKIKKQFPVLKINTFVRIAKQKGKFSRSYHEQSNQEIFKIYKIDTTKKIPLYYLQTYNGDEQIQGGFYKFELTPVKADIFRIEKILKERKKNGKKQFFVKWKGFKDSYNEWIDEENIEQTF